MSGDLAAAGVYALLFVEAVVPDNTMQKPAGAVLARPATVLLMGDALGPTASDALREDYRDAALRGQKQVAEVLVAHQVSSSRWYADNSRETLRDEVFPLWQSEGALWVDPAVQTTSSRPRYALRESFAHLFDPALTDTALEAAIAGWIATNATPSTKARIAYASSSGHAANAVTVSYPDGSQRQLDPGGSSEIIKALIEQWVPARLDQPLVVAVAESKTKVHVADAGMLKLVGLTIDPQTFVPDILIADVSVPEFWFIEVVFTDGPITAARRQVMVDWATAQGLNERDCRFLTAFASRTAQSARRRFQDLAVNSYAWYADEPSLEVHLGEI